MAATVAVAWAGSTESTTTYTSSARETHILSLATHRAALSWAKISVYAFLDRVFLDVLGVREDDEFANQTQRKDLDPQYHQQRA